MKPCALCGAVAVDNLCVDHRREFLVSGESGRLNEILVGSLRLGCGLSMVDRSRLRVALVDYVRRVQAERRNGAKP